MPRVLRLSFRAAAVVAAASLLALAAGWLATRGEYPVPPTVADDPSLPSVTVDGVRLHVRTYGDPGNPTVVVVHGGPGNDFRYLLPLAALADRYHVVFYDQRGSGLSERVPDDRLRLEGFYAELDGIVDRFGGGRPVRLIGHSWGAMLAAGYLGRHPEKVLQAVLAASGMLTPDAAAEIMRATNGFRPPLTGEVLRIGAEAWLRSLHVHGPDADARRDFLAASVMTTPFEGHPTAGYFCGRDLRTARLDAWRFGARAASALLGGVPVVDGVPQLDFVAGVGRFPRKVLFLAGACDAVLGEARQRRQMASFRAAELVVVPGAGHTMFGERPDESVAAVRRYFDEAG